MMAMAAGDFVEVYGRPGQAGRFNCVATCFFLDCAHNIIDFIEIIHRILKVCCLSIDAMPISILLTDRSQKMLPQHRCHAKNCYSVD